MPGRFISRLLPGEPFGVSPDDGMQGGAVSVSEWAQSSQATEFRLFAGRVNTVSGIESIDGLPIIPRDDGSATVNLLDVSEPATYQATLREGGSAQVIVEPRQQKRGFASGIQYWLPLDAQGRFIFEPGQRHRKVYVSGSPSAMSRADIAADAGVSESTVTGSWMMSNTQYGGSTGNPIAMDVFEILFAHLYGGNREARSDWFLFERGYTYDRGGYWAQYVKGEDELHPFLFGAWGTGARPFFPKGFEWIGLGPRYMALRDLEFNIFHPRHGYGVIAEGCRISGPHESQFRDLYMVTWKDTILRDITKLTPGGNPVRTYWDGSQDRMSGAYGGSGKYLMMSGVIVDMCGWAKGYDFNRSAAFPMPPSDRNHGLYLTFSCRDLTLRDTVISQNASCGTQIRCGGYYERLLALDNNVALAIHSGTQLGPINQFATLADSVVFGAAHKRVASFQGALNIGLDVSGFQTTQVGNIVAHRANPDDQAEYDDRTNYVRPEWTGGRPYNGEGRFYFNDTQVWEWWEDANAQPKNENVAGLDFNLLQQTTIHRYAGSKVGQTWVSIDAFIDWLETQANIAVAVKEAIGWTKNRFGRPLPARTAAANLSFVPDHRMDGFRWDNRRNWSDSTLPGANAADTVDLKGNFVRFGTVNSAIASLRTSGGALDVSSGRLTVGTVLDQSIITVQRCGQLYLGASTDALSISTKAGRVAFTGAIANVDLNIEGSAQGLLGPSVTIPAGKKLSIGGPRAMAGWDGTGTAELTVNGVLEFRVGATVEIGDALYKQRLVNPGDPLLASESGMTAKMSLFEERQSSGKSLVHLYDPSALPNVGEKLTVGYTEYIADDGDYNTLQTVNVAAVIARAPGQLRRFRSGSILDGVTEPTVTVTVALSAISAVVVLGREMLAPGTYDLTGPGITVVNNGATLPAGVAVVGGVLRLTVS